MQKIEFQKVSNLPVLQDNFSLVSRSVSDSGAGLFLFVESTATEQVTERIDHGSGVFPKTRMGDRKRFALVEMFDNKRRDFELPALDLTFPLVDVFPDGKFLVAGSRSEWRAEGDYDRNGVVFDPTTGAQTEILLGDGIESVAVDSLGRIWVAYFDEGVFGNLGWGHFGPPPVGASGLNCFSDDGEILWSFPDDDEFGAIADCYAMNVQGESAIVSFYTEFPLCRVSGDFERRYWETGLEGCRHLAINESSVLFSGQYNDEPAIGYHAIMGDRKLRKLRQIEFCLPDKTPISSGHWIGRGAEMHFFDESGWYRARLSESDS